MTAVPQSAALAPPRALDRGADLGRVQVTEHERGIGILSVSDLVRVLVPPQAGQTARWAHQEQARPSQEERRQIGHVAYSDKLNIKNILKVDVESLTKIGMVIPSNINKKTRSSGRAFR